MYMTAASLSRFPDLENQKYLSKSVIRALVENDTPKLEELRISGELLNVCDKRGNTLLHLAIQNQTIKAFEYLLSLDEIPKNVYNGFGNSALMEAYSRPHAEKYAIMLIEAGCDYKSYFPDGNTALHCAVSNGWVKTVELLIELDCDIECRNLKGEKPLYLAAKAGNKELIWLLLSFGADPTSKCKLSNFEYRDYISFTYVTCFDAIVDQKNFDKNFCFKQLSPFEKHFSLVTFMDAMEKNSDVFYDLLDNTDFLSCSYYDCKAFFERIHLFNPEMLKLFVGEFGHVFKNNLARYCLEAFRSDSKCLHKQARHLFVLLESEVRDIFLDETSKNSTFMSELILNIVRDGNPLKRLDLLTEILLSLLSYGADIDNDAMGELYCVYGYCNLFKMLRHMNINCQSPVTYVMPRMIYDLSMNLNSVIFADHYYEYTVSRLSQYFTLRKKCYVNISVPLLQELARDSAREYIISRYKIKSSGMFYSILERLPIAQIHKKIIAFETKLYKVEKQGAHRFFRTQWWN